MVFSRDEKPYEGDWGRASGEALKARMMANGPALDFDLKDVIYVPKANARKVFIKSYGCQMNVYDGARMADTLAREGYDETKFVEDADLVILNTCHIRERASEKVFSELGRMNEIKLEREKRGESTTLAVAGCVAQAEGSEIIRRQPAVDLVIGTQSFHHLPRALRQARAGSRPVITDFGLDDKFGLLAPPVSEKIKARGVTAFVTVQEGCDKFCAFCVVPYTRGAEMSRPVEKILAEIEHLAESGVREVTLLGQNVNGYHGVDGSGVSVSIARLVERISEISSISRVRYTTSHPCDMDDSLVEAHRDLPKLMPFLHLPVQSGSDRVLKAMNRKHTAKTYRAVIDRLRKARPDIALSSDFIVGFPGETRSEFDETLALVRDVGFVSAFSFKFSSRPGTPASTLPDQVDEAEKASRLNELQVLLDEQRRSFNRASVGSTVDILFEKDGRHFGQIAGKTPYLQALYVDGPRDLIGRVATVEVVELRPNSLRGRLLQENDE